MRSLQNGSSVRFSLFCPQHIGMNGQSTKYVHEGLVFNLTYNEQNNKGMIMEGEEYCAQHISIRCSTQILHNHAVEHHNLTHILLAGVLLTDKTYQQNITTHDYNL